MSRVRVVLNHTGVHELLQSAEIQEALYEQASKIAGSKGEAKVVIAKTRAIAIATGDDGNNGLLKRMQK